MNFSVVLIARNEAKTLPRLLASLTEFRQQGGEVVLLDTGSSDDTMKVAADAGCRAVSVGEKFLITVSTEEAEAINKKFVFENEAAVIAAGDRIFDFAAARNYAASLASNDMIAMPDCDEMYTKLDLEKITRLIGEGVTQFSYNFVYSHDAAGKELIKFAHSKFYNRKVMKWTGVIHEVLTFTHGDVEHTHQWLGEDVIKLEHYQNPATDRSNYLRGLAYDCYKNPNNDRNCHYFARELMYNNRPHSALEAFSEHISMDRWLTEKAQSMIFVGDCFKMLGQEEDAVKSYLWSFATDSSRREPFMRLAEHYYYKGDHQRAACYAAAALQIPETVAYMNWWPYYTYLPHEILYWALWYLGQKEESKKHFEIAKQLNPESEKYKQDQQFYN